MFGRSIPGPGQFGSIHLAITTMPSGYTSSSRHHINRGSEIYAVRGKGRFITGDKLETNFPSDLKTSSTSLPNTVHQQVKDSQTEPLEMILARDTSVEIVVEPIRIRHLQTSSSVTSLLIPRSYKILTNKCSLANIFIRHSRDLFPLRQTLRVEQNTALGYTGDV